MTAHVVIVELVINHDNYVEVVDVGCAECRLLRLLRREGSVRELVGVDVQARLLEAQRASLQPLTSDFVQPRPHPLTVRLMQGTGHPHIAVCG